MVKGVSGTINTVFKAKKEKLFNSGAIGNAEVYRSSFTCLERFAAGKFNRKIFLLDSDNSENLYPMLNRKRNTSAFFLGLTDPIKEYDDFEFEFIKSYSVKSRMADYHYNSELMFSKRIVDVLKGFNLYNVDYLDASLTDNRGNTNYDYHLLHIRNHIECLDKKRSSWLPPAYGPNEVWI